MAISEYELQRLANMAANAAKLVHLGLEDPRRVRPAPAIDVAAKRMAIRPPRALPAPTNEPRKTRSRAKEPDELAEAGTADATADDDDQPHAGADGKLSSRPRPSTWHRLSPRQAAQMHEIAPPRPALSALQAGKLKYVRAYLQAHDPSRFTSGLERFDVSHQVRRRQLLRHALGNFALPLPPAWLDELERYTRESKNEDNVQKVMLALEKGTTGIGMDWPGLPEDCGVLLPLPGTAADALPRVLTLGSDTEALKEEVRRHARAQPPFEGLCELTRLSRLFSRLRQAWAIECAIHRDKGNGWGARHALSRLHDFQAHMLDKLCQGATHEAQSCRAEVAAHQAERVERDETRDLSDDDIVMSKVGEGESEDD